MEWKIGMRVKHKQLGYGIIKEINGNQVHLALENYNQYKFPASIEDLDVPKGNLSRKKTIEALRFGLVPQEEIERLTIGYGLLKEWVDFHLDRLEYSQPTVSVIHGPFGTGKSHALEITRYIAYQRGFLIASAEVDGQHISLAKPSKLFGEIARTLKGKDFETEIPLYELFFHTIHNGNPKPHLFRQEDWLGANYDLIKQIQQTNLREELAEDVEKVLSGNDEVDSIRIIKDQIRKYPWFSGRGIEVMPVFTRSSQVEEFLKALIGYAYLARLIGRKGLVITIDEVEVESSILPPSERRKAIMLLDRLWSYFEDQKDEYPNAPFALIFATVEDDSEINQVIDHLVEKSGGRPYELPYYKLDELIALGREITDLYKEAYFIPIENDTDLMQEIISRFADRIYQNNGVIRDFIKSFMHELDRRYGPPRRIGNERGTV
ncbi:BREX system ATP-binding domain-containing protein [Thermicanus aegyptius]|uniref:BREX system ATP-binding domain-containing protein n=1 Tax=Thermicanus aegyptius TaxID=94009 RepID=UPI00040C91AE|nr:BREX system ATP-binding domain-containing protein [Thermicanus aegyptius]